MPKTTKMCHLNPRKKAKKWQKCRPLLLMNSAQILDPVSSIHENETKSFADHFHQICIVEVGEIYPSAKVIS